MNYELCITLSNNPIQKGCENSAQEWLFCQKTKTSCSILPAPQKLPLQVEWTSHDNFNPFTQIKVKLESGTFNGSLSGLRNFSIL